MVPGAARRSRADRAASARRARAERASREALPQQGATTSHLQSLAAVRGTRLYEGVAAQLQELISAGKLRPGDKLPSERELVAAFQVSRGSVRDAIRVLEAQGAVRARQGGGVTVQEASTGSVVAPIAALLTRKRSLARELMEVRGILEPALAARAARRATSADVARLREILARHAERVRRRETAMEEDAEFHRALAEAAGNSVVLRVVDLLMDLLAHTRSAALQWNGKSPSSLRGHERLVDAIERRAPRAAERAMAQHLDEVTRAMFRRDGVES